MKDLIITITALWLIYPTVVISSSIANEISNKIYDYKRQLNNEYNTLQLIETQGYPAEAHAVTTEDGYILTMHRIPGKKGSPAVFLQHGLLGASADWVLLGKNRSLAFMLSDLGYDVWLGNYRGNTYSRAHVSLSTNDEKFWDFSWHENGIHDIPAMLTHIVTLKGKPLRAYFGFSMGTTGFFVLSSERPDIAKLVESAYVLAPVAYVNHIRSPLMRLIAFADGALKEIIDHFAHGELLPDSPLMRTLSRIICDTTTLGERLCANILFLITGFDNEQFDYDIMPTLTNHLPAGGSMKQLVHYCQLIKSGYFRQYDYGRHKNMKLYNTTEPPNYDIARVTKSLAMFWGENDWLADPEDVSRFIKDYPHDPISYKVPLRKFNHIDFLLAKNARELVYNQVTTILVNNTLGVNVDN